MEIHIRQISTILSSVNNSIEMSRNVKEMQRKQALKENIPFLKELLAENKDKDFERSLKRLLGVISSDMQP